MATCRVKRNTKTGEVGSVLVDRPFNEERANQVYAYFNSIGIPVRVSIDEMRDVLRQRGYNLEVTSDNRIGVSPDIIVNKPLEFLTTPFGEVLGFVDIDGTIYVDPDVAGTNTLIHEGAHIWIKGVREAAKKGDPRAKEIYNTIRDIVAPTVNTIIDTKKTGSLPTLKYVETPLDFDSDEYRGYHTAPNEDDKAIYDLLDVWGEDIYSNEAYFYYGDGDIKMDKASVRILQEVRNNPDALVTVYRAVPIGVTTINSGDWVSINREYAEAHGELLEGAYEIISKELPARQIFTDGNSLHEQGVVFNNEVEDLFVVHNMTLESLNKTSEDGRIPSPSVAIANKDIGFAPFGEISLVGGNEIINPSNPENRVFSADAYTPRYPEVTTQYINKRSELVEELANVLPEGVFDIESFYRSFNPNYSRSIKREDAVKLLAAKYQDLELLREDGRREYFNNKYGLEFLEELRNLEAEIFPTVEFEEIEVFEEGNLKVTPENALFIMKQKGIRAAEFTEANHLPGAFRAKFAPELKTMREIRSNRGSIVSSKEFNTIRDQISEDFHNIVNDFAYEYEVEDMYATFSSEALELLEKGESESYGKISEEDHNKLREFMNLVMTAPTEYFEAKPQRLVSMQEFSAAFVPSGVLSREQKDRLISYGLEVYEYSNEEDRRLKVKGFVEQRELAFQTNEMSSKVYNKLPSETDAAFRERLEEEVFARLMGDNAEEYLDSLGFTKEQAKTFIGRVKEFLEQIGEWLRGKKGFQDMTMDDIMQMSIVEFLDKSTTSLMLGEYVGPSDRVNVEELAFNSEVMITKKMPELTALANENAEKIKLKSREERIKEKEQEGRRVLKTDTAFLESNRDRLSGEVLKMGQPSDILKSVGITNKIETTTNFLERKVVGLKKHDLNFSSIEQIMRDIHNPAMVVKGEQGRVILVTDSYSAEGRPIVYILDNNYRKSNGEVVANITTGYALSNLFAITGEPLYVNNKKLANVLSAISEQINLGLGKPQIGNLEYDASNNTIVFNQPPVKDDEYHIANIRKIIQNSKSITNRTNVGHVDFRVSAIDMNGSNLSLSSSDIITYPTEVGDINYYTNSTGDLSQLREVFVTKQSELSETYYQLASIPGITKNQALEAYKHLYNIDMYNWETSSTVSCKNN